MSKTTEQSPTATARGKLSALVGTTLALCFSLYCLAVNFILAFGNESSDPKPSLLFLERAIASGSDDRAQLLFPEGYVLMNGLYGLAQVAVGKQAPPGSLEQQHSIQEAHAALKRLDLPKASHRFRSSRLLRNGVFYRGWNAYLKGQLIDLLSVPKAPQDLIDSFKNDVEEIQSAFSQSETPFLEAYRGLSWPVDSVVAIAALRLHEKLFHSSHAEVIATWIRKAKERIDPETGLLPHRVDAAQGRMLTGARGSSQTLLLRFLPEIDPEWAASQYMLFRSQFVQFPLGVPGIREFPQGYFRLGDIDSGPLIFGTSASASAVAIGTALAFGDYELADVLSRTAQAFGIEMKMGEESTHLFGLVPIGDAFLTWSHTAALVTKIPELPRTAPPDWVLMTHGSSAAAVLIFMGWIRLRRWISQRRATSRMPPRKA
jgi:hypothetical protein